MASSPSVYSIKGVCKDVEAIWVIDVIDVAPVTIPASTLIVPSIITAEPAAGSKLKSSAEVSVIAPEVVCILIAASPGIILSAAIEDAVILAPEILPLTVKSPVIVASPLVVIAPPSEMVNARSPSV